MIEFHSQIASQNCKVMFLLGEEDRWTSTSAILDKSAGLDLNKQCFAVMAFFSSIKQLKAVRLRSEDSYPLYVVGMVTTELQKKQLRREVGFPAVLEFATNVIQETAETAFIGK